MTGDTYRSVRNHPGAPTMAWIEARHKHPRKTADHVADEQVSRGVRIPQQSSVDARDRMRRRRRDIREETHDRHINDRQHTGASFWFVSASCPLVAIDTSVIDSPLPDLIWQPGIPVADASLVDAITVAGALMVPAGKPGEMRRDIDRGMRVAGLFTIFMLVLSLLFGWRPPRKTPVPAYQPLQDGSMGRMPWLTGPSQTEQTAPDTSSYPSCARTVHVRATLHRSDAFHHPRSPACGRTTTNACRRLSVIRKSFQGLRTDCTRPSPEAAHTLRRRHTSCNDTAVNTPVTRDKNIDMAHLYPAVSRLTVYQQAREVSLWTRR
jgi:hypothetical protein